MGVPSAPGARRILIHTLGCPKNDADSRSLARRLNAAGLEVVDDPTVCTHVVINTCGFIQDAKEESIAAILATCAEHEGARVAVMGCLVERYRQELQAGIPEVGAWFGLGEEDRLLAFLTTGAGTGEEAEARTDLRPSHPAPGSTLGLHPPLSYAYVKISDGCDEPCTFCAIPSIKGPYCSVGIDAVLQEVDACLREGAKEIVLVGQDTAVWRSGGLDLLGLLDLLAADRRLERLRIMYLQPEHVSDELLRYMAEQPKVCRYLDIPLQHAAAEVLRRMGRWGDRHAYRHLVDRARRLMPDISLRTTFIVGFPGETEAQFQELLDFVDEIGFDHAGGFVYSPEEGTVGAGLRPRVPLAVAVDRLNRLTERLYLGAELRHRRSVGGVVEVLLDELVSDDDDGVTALGRTCGQAPEVDGVTYLEGDLPEGTGPGDLVKVTVTDAIGHDLVGRWDAS